MSDNPPIIAQAIDMVAESRPDIAAVLRTLPIAFERMPPNAAAVFHQTTNSIGITPDNTAEVEDLAGALIHEGQHALDFRNGTLGPPDQPEVVDNELRAYTSELAFIKSRNPTGKPERDHYDTDINHWFREQDEGNLRGKIQELYYPTFEQMLDALTSGEF